MTVTIDEKAYSSTAALSHTLRDERVAARGMPGRPTVVAMKYNHWAHPQASIAPGSAASIVGMEGSTYEVWDAFPWRCLQGYPEKIPLAAREMRARPYWTFNDDQSVNHLLNGWTSNGTATLTRASNQLVLTPLVNDNYIFSPQYLSLPGDLYPTVRITFTRTGGSGWDGRIYFITDDDTTYNGTKSVSFADPGAGEQTVNVTMSGNATWNAGVIRRIRIDLGNTIADTFTINSIEIVGNGSAKLRERIIGLPITEQWAVDWELRTAYDHGVDVFAVCHFQDNLTDVGKHKWYFDRFNASTVTEPIKACIIGIFQSPYETLYTSTGAIQTLADFYSDIITETGDRYWKIDGRPVIQFFAESTLASQLITSGVPSAYTGGATVANIKIALAHFVSTLRARILANTGMNPYLVDQHNGSFPSWFGKNSVFTNIIEAAGFDAATSYIHRTAHYNHAIDAGGGSALNWPPSSPDNATTSEQLVRSYSTMVECRDRNLDWIYGESGFGIPYWPHVTVGWCRHPWAERDQVIFNPEDLNWPSLTQLRQNFASAQKYIEKYGTERTGNVVTIYAWDEYGEGGVLAPTKGLGHMALQAMREGLKI